MSTNTIARTHLTAEQRELLKRHRRQLRQRTLADYKRLLPMRAVTFLPDGRSLALPSPIERFGTVSMLMLSYERASRASDVGPYRIMTRRYKPQLSPLGHTHWYRRPGPWEFNVSLPISDNSRGPALPVTDPIFANTVLDLDRACHRVSNSDRVNVATGWTSPPTLLAFPVGTPFEPQLTPYVRKHAQRSGLNWGDAWHDLYEGQHVPAQWTPTGLNLIDSRLCSLEELRSSGAILLGAYHDFRRMTGRPLSNPVRRIESLDDTSDDSVVRAMSEAMPRRLLVGCSNANLLIAAANPDKPLIASGLATIQVWREETTPTRRRGAALAGAC